MISSFWNGSEGQTPRGRVGLFECECGCGQTFFSSFRTRHPRYVNKTHRARAYRARAKARIDASEDCMVFYDGDFTFYPELYASHLSRLMAKHRRH